MVRPRISKEKIAKAKIVTTRSFMAILGIAFGFLITAQWRSIPERVSNPVAPYISLKETKNSLYDEQTSLKNEIKDLQANIQKTQKDSENISLTKDQLETLKIKKAHAGLTKLNGPGVIINLDDSKGNLTSEDSIVHASDLRDIVNLLWGSGAEAITVNGQRVVINTAIDCIVNTILVNDVRLSVPFRIEAIGNRDFMFDRINSPFFIANIHDRARNQGIIFDMQKNNDITVPVFDGSYDAKMGGNN